MDGNTEIFDYFCNVFRKRHIIFAQLSVNELPPRYREIRAILISKECTLYSVDFTIGY